MQGIANAMEFILGQEDGKKRFLQAVAALSKAFALAKQMREAQRRGEKLGLSEDEAAFCDALAANEEKRQPRTPRS